MKHPSRHKFAPVGFCIYCDSKEENPTDEHIVPYALGGNLLLPASSCSGCQAMTKLFTDRVSRQIYHPFRVRMNVQSRTKKKEKPLFFPVWGQTSSGFTREIQVPAHLFPRTYHVPVLTPPSSITGINRPDFFRATRREVRADIDELYKQGIVGPKEFFMIKEQFSTVDFFRQLAQIGHAYMFAILRGRGAIPWLEHMILGPGRPKTRSQPELPDGPWYDYQHFIGGVEPHEEIAEVLNIDVVKGVQAYMVRVRFRMPIEQGWDFPTYQIMAGWIPHQGRLEIVEKLLSDWRPD